MTLSFIATIFVGCLLYPLTVVVVQIGFINTPTFLTLLILYSVGLFLAAIHTFCCRKQAGKLLLRIPLIPSSRQEIILFGGMFVLLLFIVLGSFYAVWHTLDRGRMVIYSSWFALIAHESFRISFTVYCLTQVFQCLRLEVREKAIFFGFFRIEWRRIMIWRFRQEVSKIEIQFKPTFSQLQNTIYLPIPSKYTDAANHIFAERLL